MRIRIEPMHGENYEHAKKCILEHPEWYGEFEEVVVGRLHFYQVLTQAGKYIGFFALAYWTNEIVVCCVYVKIEYRRHGIFKKIIRFSRRKTPRKYALTINAMSGNNTANTIYTKMFGEPFKYDRDEDIFWYVCKYPRARIKKSEGN